MKNKKGLVFSFVVFFVLFLSTVSNVLAAHLQESEADTYISATIKPGTDADTYERLYRNSQSANRYSGKLELASWIFKGVATLTGTSSGLTAIVDATNKGNTSIATAALSFISATLVVGDLICTNKLNAYRDSQKLLENFLNTKTIKAMVGLKSINKKDYDEDIVKSAIETRYREILGIIQVPLGSNFAPETPFPLDINLVPEPPHPVDPE